MFEDSGSIHSSGAPVQFLSIDFCDSSSDEERDSSTGVNSALYGSFTDLHRLTDQSMMEQKNNCSYSDLSSDEGELIFKRLECGMVHTMV